MTAKFCFGETGLVFFNGGGVCFMVVTQAFVGGDVMGWFITVAHWGLYGCVFMGVT